MKSRNVSPPSMFDFLVVKNQVAEIASLRSVAVVQIIFGLLCISLQVSLFLIDGNTHTYANPLIFGVSIGLLSSLAGVCCLLLRVANLLLFKLALSGCLLNSTGTVAACFVYLIISFTEFLTALTNLENPLSVIESKYDELHFWFLTAIFLCVIILLLFTFAGIMVIISAGRASANYQQKEEQLCIVTATDRWNCDH